MEQETENLQETETKDNKNGFGKGMIAGMCITLVAGFAAIMLWTYGLGNYIDVYTKAKKQSEENTFFNSKVQNKLEELLGYINLYYYDEPERAKLEEGLYRGLLEGVDDKYTAYYNPEEYKKLQESSTDIYYGIGAVLSQDKETMVVTISSVYEGSPSEKAGLKKDDIIVSVDDIESTTMELGELVKHIRGEEGTTVHLKILREGDSDYREMDVERADIDLPTVDSKMLEHQIGYLQITDFGANTAAQFEEALQELQNQGMKALVLDVRSNPGGMIVAVTQILDDILPKGVTVYTQDKYGKKEVFESDDEKCLKMPIAVLVNGNSASASEILAGAIRDFEYGTLIGTTTYGKGVVQNIYPLKDGDAIKLTIAKYFTPSGENIHGKGITPDIELEFEYSGDQTKEYDAMKDNQVLKALEVLEGELNHE